MIFPCVKSKIHNYKNTQIRKYKVLKRPKFTFTLTLTLTFTLHLQIDGASSRFIERYFYFTKWNCHSKSNSCVLISTITCYLQL